MTDQKSNVEFGVFWGPEIRQKLGKKEVLIEQLLYAGDVICISADPGVGKSILALQLMFNLTTGTPFLGTFDIPKVCNVLYVQSEGDRSETVERIEAMEGGLKIDDERWAHINIAGITLNTVEGFENFKKLSSLPGIEYDVIIIDPLYTTVKGSLKEDNVATDWIRNVRTIKELYKECAMIVLHHDTKETFQDGKAVPRRADNVFGSVFWGAYLSYNYKLTKHNNVHTLTLGKRRTSKSLDKIEMRLMEPFPLMYVYADEDASIAKRQVEKVIIDNREGITAKGIIEKTELSKATVFRVLKILKEGGLINKVEHKFAPLYISAKISTKAT